MGLNIRIFWWRNSFLSRGLEWVKSFSRPREKKLSREIRSELTEAQCSLIHARLEEATNLSDRSEAVRFALATGMPLAEIEMRLDWLEAKRKNEHL